MKIVAVTACPTGVVYTYMAAEALEKAANDKGIEIKVETQGVIGIENKLTFDDIKNADVVILTKDVEIKEIERFKGKKIIKVGIGDVVRYSDKIIEKVKD